MKQRALVLLALLSTGALAQEQGVTLFEAKDFRGRFQTFSGDVPDLRGTSIGENSASSVRVSPGCEAVLFSDTGFRGHSLQVTGDVRNLQDSSVGNDRVSSLRVRCTGRIVIPGREPVPESNAPYGVTLYRGTRFRGRSQTFTSDVGNLRGSPFGNDSANSVRVSPGCRATLYTAADFEGYAAEVQGDEENLAYTDVGGDSVSSLRVRCRAGDPHGRPPYGGPPGGPGGPGGYGITLFRDYEFRGPGETFTGDVPNLEGSRFGNDAARSVRVPRGCRVTLYERADYRGRAADLTGDVPDLSRTPIGDDAVSSFRVRCSNTGEPWNERPPEGVVLFSDYDFRGRSQTLVQDVPNLAGSIIGNDRLRSIRVPPGCHVTLYEAADFRGRAVELVGSEPDLSRTQIGDDTVSSIRVRCPGRY